MAELPPPPEGIVLTHFIVSDDVERSRRFARRGVRVNAEITGEILHIDGGQPPCALSRLLAARMLSPRHRIAGWAADSRCEFVRASVGRRWAAVFG
jgi:hypothetical protein